MNRAIGIIPDGCLSFGMKKYIACVWYYTLFIKISKYENLRKMLFRKKCISVHHEIF